MDKITVYSNGLAEFNRQYPVNGSTRLAIPFKKDSIQDVLSTFMISGNVELEKPVTFTPTNNDNVTLSIDSANVMEDLLTKLSGARITITRAINTAPLTGINMGVSKETVTSNGVNLKKSSLVLMVDGNIQQILFSDIQSFSVDDNSLKDEITKALNRNIQQTKPDSSFIELSLKSEKPTEANIRYVIPSAAWKMTYRFEKINKELRVIGFAIIDNNTDEDWKDAIISIVSGQPTTFISDLAEQRIPKRSRINVVEEEVVTSEVTEVTPEGEIVVEGVEESALEAK